MDSFINWTKPDRRPSIGAAKIARVRLIFIQIRTISSWASPMIMSLTCRYLKVSKWPPSRRRSKKESFKKPRPFVESTILYYCQLVLVKLRFLWSVRHKNRVCDPTDGSPLCALCVHFRIISQSTAPTNDTNSTEISFLWHPRRLFEHKRWCFIPLQQWLGSKKTCDSFCQWRPTARPHRRDTPHNQ